MDRIRKALDIARQERDQPELVVAERAADFGAAAAEPRTVTRLATAIVYAKSRLFVPDARTLESNRIVNPAGADPAAAAFRMLRTQVLQRLNENHWRSVAILSPGSSDGKTTTAINLAVSLASDQRHTVLLVDCDLRRPSVARMLGMEPEFGIDDVLRGDASLEQCFHHPADFDRLVILPARASLANSSEWLAGPRGRELVSELRGRYSDRIILFDLPPLLGADDALAFLPLVECGLMVTAEGETRREDLIRCMELSRRTPIVGTVLNRASDAASGYG